MKAFALFFVAASCIFMGKVSAFPAFNEPAKFAEYIKRANEKADGTDAINDILKRAAKQDTNFNNFSWDKVTIPNITTLQNLITPQEGFGHRLIQTFIAPDLFLYDHNTQGIDLSSPLHKYIPPKAGDIRGACPGLNILANHGYISRTGVTNFFEATAAATLVFGLGPATSAILAAIAVVFNGNILDLSYSIGGPPPTPHDLGALSSILLGSPRGLNAHNLYEGDASLVRQDYYAPGANYDNYNLHMPYFMDLLKLGNFDDTPGKDVYNPQVFLRQKANRWHQSVETNPLFFSSILGGTIVTTGADRFAAEFASNNTVDEHGFNRIYLDEVNLLPFFGVTKGEDGSYSYTPGTEHLDPTWHRRPLLSIVELPDMILNIVLSGLIDLNLISIGGNVGQVNSYTGIDVGDLVGGAIRTADLLENPQYLACLLYQVGIEELIPSQLNILYESVGQTLSFIEEQLFKPFSKFANAGNNPCKTYTVNKNIGDIYSKFPGSNFNSTKH